MTPGVKFAVVVRRKHTNLIGWNSGVFQFLLSNWVGFFWWQVHNLEFRTYFWQTIATIGFSDPCCVEIMKKCIKNAQYIKYINITKLYQAWGNLPTLLSFWPWRLYGELATNKLWRWVMDTVQANIKPALATPSKEITTLQAEKSIVELLLVMLIMASQPTPALTKPPSEIRV